MRRFDLNNPREIADNDPGTGTSAIVLSSDRETFTTRMVKPLPHHIVIVGGGASGLELATKLGGGLGRSGRARITLVDSSRTHIWKPLLDSIAAGSLRRSRHELNYMAQAHWRNFRYRNGEMIGLDRAAKTITLAPLHDEDGREICPQSSLAYDTLVIAVGSVTNDFGTPGVKELSVPLETPEQASRFNRRVVNAFLGAKSERADPPRAAARGDHRRGRDWHRARRRAAPYGARDRRLRARQHRSRA